MVLTEMVVAIAAPQHQLEALFGAWIVIAVLVVVLETVTYFHRLAKLVGGSYRLDANATYEVFYAPGNTFKEFILQRKSTETLQLEVTLLASQEIRFSWHGRLSYSGRPEIPLMIPEVWS